MTQPHILLPFSDDSTLFFAQGMQRLLSPLPCRTSLVQLTDGATLSPRQLALLPQGPDLRISQADLASPQVLAGVDGIVTSKMFYPLQTMLGDDADRRPLRPVPRPPRRPVVVAFLPGLNLTPERGFTNRRAADAVFLVPARDIDTYRAHSRKSGARTQWVDFGHPSFLRPTAVSPDRSLTDRRDIYFFAQAISPLTRRSRMHMLAVLAALARRHPDRTVWIKLRHLPGENTDHVHREEHDYPSLLAQMIDAPANLQLTACPMAEAAAKAAIGIACTSTAAADLVQAGVPTQVYLDYPDNYLDPLMPPMRRLFAGSGLVVTLREVLDGVVNAPDPAWLADMFCPHDLGERVLACIAAVRAG